MTQHELLKGIELIQVACSDAGLTCSSERTGEFGRSVRVTMGKSVSVGGRMESRDVELTLSWEFVTDLPATRGYQEALRAYLQALALRLQNPVVTQFMTLSGLPLDLEIEWPFRRADGRDAFVIRIVAACLEPVQNREARLVVLISGTVSTMVFGSLVPPLTESLVINAVRSAIDRKVVSLYDSASHPTERQSVTILSSNYDDKNKRFIFATPTDSEIKEFLKRKVYWLGFRQMERPCKVLISDPYDAEYLGTTTTRLKQAARVLAAQSELELDSGGDFGQATDTLLKDSDRFEEEVQRRFDEREDMPQTPEAEVGARTSSRVPSAFISYSSADQAFAIKLAEDLKGRNLGVWFDKWEIKVGDSLIQKIGHGIRQNDFLIVVLSPASVRSEWVKKELYEAMQKEIAEKRVVVLPVLWQPCERPPFLLDKKYADFTLDYESGLRELVSAIESHSQKAS